MIRSIEWLSSLMSEVASAIQILHQFPWQMLYLPAVLCLELEELLFVFLWHNFVVITHANVWVGFWLAFVCLFSHMISQKPVQLGSTDMSPGNPFILGSKGPEAQKNSAAVSFCSLSSSCLIYMQSVFSLQQFCRWCAACVYSDSRSTRCTQKLLRRLERNSWSRWGWAGYSNKRLGTCKGTMQCSMNEKTCYMTLDNNFHVKLSPCRWQWRAAAVNEVGHWVFWTVRSHIMVDNMRGDANAGKIAKSSIWRVTGRSALFPKDLNLLVRQSG